MTADQIAALLDAVPLPLMLIGRDERVKAINDAAEALFGRGAVGRHYITILRQPALLDCVESALKTASQTRGRLLTRDASRDATYRLVATPLVAEGIDGVMLSLEDISHVEAASAMRRDFVANVSHELRTPLTALMGFIDTLQRPGAQGPCRAGAVPGHHGARGGADEPADQGPAVAQPGRIRGTHAPDRAGRCGRAGDLGQHDAGTAGPGQRRDAADHRRG